MMGRRLSAMVLTAAGLLQLAAGAASLEVRIDAESARAVLEAVADSSLTRERALAIASLPGNGGLIEKARSYGLRSDVSTLADALLSAARHESSDADSYFGFATVRDNAAGIQKLLSALTDPSARTLQDLKSRIALLTPSRIGGEVVGYLVAGGGSGGFAFNTPKFYMNLAKYPSVALARTVLVHELYHAVQGLAPPPAQRFRADCVQGLPGGHSLALLFGSLWEEGTASYAGDVMQLPESDEASKSERNHLQTNIGRVKQSITLLELSVHALATSVKIGYDDIYGLGFYDDEILYALGYLMSRAIATELGAPALADLIDKPPTDFVITYTSLKSYGKDRYVPKLDPETVEWATKLGQCAAR